MITIREIEWLAGFIEGEGWFSKGGFSGVRVSIGQNQKWPLEKCQRILGGSLRWQSRGNSSQGGIWIWKANGVLARSVMMTIYGLMSPWRQQQIRETLEWSNSFGIWNKLKTHCPKGHAYTVKWSPTHQKNRRMCVECHRAYYWRDGHARKRVWKKAAVGNG